jgi:xylitol oxidase
MVATIEEPDPMDGADPTGIEGATMTTTDDTTGAQLRTWAGNLTYSARRLVEPESLDELRAVVAGSARIRALGTRHSFSPVADTSGDLVGVARLPRRIEVDPDRRTATVSAGLRFGEVTPELHRQGWALANLGSLPHISVAGAAATGTHGSGAGNRVLGASIAAVELVTADGDLVTLTRGDDRFAGAVVALGRLGVVTALTLDVEPAYEVRQLVHLGLPGEAALEHALELLDSAYSASLFTDWTDPLEFQVLGKHRLDGLGEPDGAGPDLQGWGAQAASAPWHPVAGMPTVNSTQQLGVPGPWFERLPHFRLEFTPSRGEELQSEYFVARDDALAALAAVAAVRDVVAPVLQVGEIRAIAADDLWLSPAYGRATVAIHFTWVADTAAALPAVRAVEGALAAFGARPHWGKVFAVPAATVRGLHPRLADSRRLAAELDPRGVFRNAFVEEFVDG